MMKIRKPTQEDRIKVSALLRSAFPKSLYEAGMVDKFHANNTPIHEWVCIHINKAVAYIAFSNAYNKKEVCGLHLAPLAVAPLSQRQGLGSELMRFALRQEQIKTATLFVLGDPRFYQKFGFEPCLNPVCPFDKNNRLFSAMRNSTSTSFTVGYELEFGRHI